MLDDTTATQRQLSQIFGLDRYTPTR